MKYSYKKEEVNTVELDGLEETTQKMENSATKRNIEFLVNIVLLDIKAEKFAKIMGDDKNNFEKELNKNIDTIVNDMKGLGYNEEQISKLTSLIEDYKNKDEIKAYLKSIF